MTGFDKVREAAAETEAPVAQPAPAPPTSGGQAPPVDPGAPPPAPPLPTHPDEYVGHWFADLINTVADVATGLSEDGSVASRDRLGESSALAVTTYTPVKFQAGPGSRGPLPAWAHWLRSVVAYSWHAVTRSQKGLKAWLVDGWKKLREKAKQREEEQRAEAPAPPEPGEPDPAQVAGSGAGADEGFEQGPRPEPKKRGGKR